MAMMGAVTSIDQPCTISIPGKSGARSDIPQENQGATRAALLTATKDCINYMPSKWLASPVPFVADCSRYTNLHLFVMPYGGIFHGFQFPSFESV